MQQELEDEGVKDQAKDKEMARELVRKFEHIKGKRTNWDYHWKEVLDKVLPEHNNVYGVFAPGMKKGIEVFDNTPTHANELLASALHGMLTNPAAYWFWLRTGNPEIDEQDEVRKWLQGAAIRMHEVMNESNFQTEIHEVYQGLGAIGTWTLLIEEDEEAIVRFLARPIYQSYIAEDFKGWVDTIYREFKLTYREVKQQFKDAEPGTKEELDREHKDEDEVELLHCVFPREDYDNQSLPKKFKYASVYVHKAKLLTLSESGYREFPYAVPRWTKMSGEIYGRSPAMKCLADIKMLNKIMLVQIKGLEKTVDPPLLVADDGVIFPLKLTPGGLTFVRAGMERPIVPLQTDARVDFGMQALEELRGRIRKTFFIDQLQIPQGGPQRTATEVNQLIEEQLRVMGPILGRLHHELLKPVINRVFAIMLRRGELPQPIPQALSKAKLQIQYSSQIARAQRTSEADNITRVLNIMGPMVQMDPTIMDRVNGDEALKFVSDIYDLPEKILRSDDEMKQKQDQRAQQQQQAEQMAVQQHQAEVINKVGPTALKAADQSPQVAEAMGMGGGQ